MTNDEWFLLIGGLLLVMGVTSSLLKRSPVTSAIIYLAVGLLFGPTVLNLFHFNPLKESALLEVLTEVAVLISLFSAGVKMPVPFSFRALACADAAGHRVDGAHRRAGGCVRALGAGPAAGRRRVARAPSWRRPTRCWPPTCKAATPATATSCASR